MESVIQTIEEFCLIRRAVLNYGKSKVLTSSYSTNIAKTQKHLFGIPIDGVKESYKLTYLRIEILNQE